MSVGLSRRRAAYAALGRPAQIWITCVCREMVALLGDILFEHHEIMPEGSIPYHELEGLRRRADRVLDATIGCNTGCWNCYYGERKGEWPNKDGIWPTPEDMDAAEEWRTCICEDSGCYRGVVPAVGLCRCWRDEEDEGVDDSV